jgi:hypothetical protein
MPPGRQAIDRVTGVIERMVDVVDSVSRHI